jgi:hypothetical protein
MTQQDTTPDPWWLPQAETAERRRLAHAKQTRQRAARKQRERDTARLLSLGADPKWVERTLGNG